MLIIHNAKCNNCNYLKLKKMDYLKKLISERVEMLNKQIMFKDVTVQTEEENKEELKQLTDALNNYDLLHNVIVRFNAL